MEKNLYIKNKKKKKKESLYAAIYPRVVAKRIINHHRFRRGNILLSLYMEIYVSVNDIIRIIQT